MRKSNFYCSVAVMAGLLIAGLTIPALAQNAPKPPAMSAAGQEQDKVVLKVGNVQVRQSEMDSLIQSLSPQAKQALERQGRKALGDQYADMLLLSHAAATQHLDSSPSFQQHIELDREQLLANMEVQKIASNVVVSPAEVNQYYTTHPQAFQQVQVCQVAVVKKAPGATTGFSPADAEAKAQAIRKALSSGETASQVRKEFAVPNQIYVQARTLSPSDPSIPTGLRTAFQLKVGAFSQVDERPNYLEFYQVTGHPVMSLKDATPAIQQGLRQQKVQAAVNSMKKQTPVWMDQSYFTPATAGGAAGAQQ